MSIGLSVLSQALLVLHLPDADWKLIIERMGYAVGLIVVMMARQQLSTENMLTAVLPVISARKLQWVWVMLRLWGIVLAANLAGAFIFAISIAHMGMLPSAEHAEFFLIGLMTYLIALGGFTHVIAGSVEAFYLWVTQAATTFDVFLRFLLPTLVGNVVGGTVLFALPSHAQVRDAIS